MTGYAGAVPATARSLPVGNAAALAATLLACVSLHPFQSLGSSSTIELSSGNETLTYLVFALLAGVGTALARRPLGLAWRALLPWPTVALAGWLALSCLISPDPVTSAKRLVLAAIMTVLGLLVVALPATPRALAAILTLSAGAVLVLSYGGVLLVPDLAVHQPTDVAEPALAGDWRGVFAHKNDAAGVLSLFVFQGLFAARRGFPVAGWAVVAAAGLFMLFAGGKSALALVVVTLAVSRLWVMLPARWPRGVLAFLPVAVLNLAGVGSVLLPAVGALVHALPGDSTFTGRVDIWAFAIGKMPGSLLFGHGFEGFWNTEATRYANTSTWVGSAWHAHNSYVDVVLSGGLPGLALLLLAFAWQPMRDLNAATRRGADPALLMLFMRTWLFCLYESAFETILFHRDDPLWLFFLSSVAGLRMAAVFRLRGHAGGPA